MDYNKFKNRLKFVDTRVEIVDDELCNKYEQMINDGQALPEDIMYETKYNTNGDKYYEFYREASNEEIATLLEISKAHNLRKISRALTFFMGLMITFLCFAGLAYILSYL